MGGGRREGVGERVVDHFGWELGERVPLEGPEEAREERGAEKKLKWVCFLRSLIFLSVAKRKGREDRRTGRCGLRRVGTALPFQLYLEPETIDVI